MSNPKKRKRGKEAVTEGGDSWYRWLAEKLAVPIVAAALGAGGGVAGAEITADAPRCESAIVTTTSTTRNADGTTSKTTTRQVTSCPDR